MLQDHSEELLIRSRSPELVNEAFGGSDHVHLRQSFPQPPDSFSFLFGVKQFLPAGS